MAVSVSGAVSAIGELNKMDGNHAATKIEVTEGENLTPWEDIEGTTDD